MKLEQEITIVVPRTREPLLLEETLANEKTNEKFLIQMSLHKAEKLFICLKPAEKVQ